MKKRDKKRRLKKRNLAAKAARQTSAGPMKDKKQLSRQEQRLADRAEGEA